MEIINTQQLEVLLTQQKGFTFVELEYTKVEAVKKRNNIHFIDYPVIKTTKLNVGFNGSYQNAVNNRLDKKDIEPDFVAQSLPWGKWKLYNKIVEHNENIYVRFYLHKNSNIKNIYMYNGEEVKDERLAELYDFLQKRTDNLRQSEAGLEFEEQCFPLTININTINSIVLNKQRYCIIK